MKHSRAFGSQRRIKIPLNPPLSKGEISNSPLWKRGVRGDFRRKGIILFLDFDGTLSPIVDNPLNATIPDDISAWLRRLSLKRKIKIGIITGRSMQDVRKRVGLKNIIYAANHGMEVYYKGRFILRKGRVYRRPLALIAESLIKELSGIPGIYLENKGLSVAVHLRRVKRNYHRKVKNLVKIIVEPWLKKYVLQLTSGKMLMEVRPVLHWNKGKAVLWIWRRLAPGYVPFYVGDDTTDEDAFSALKPYGITVRIGRKAGSHAEYYIPSISRLADSDFFN
jgi:trehalose-phosphatase